MSEFEFDNIYPNGSTRVHNKFTMGVPAIYSVGLGYSKGIVDFALDYRYVDYANTDGFDVTGWTQYWFSSRIWMGEYVNYFYRFTIKSD